MYYLFKITRKGFNTSYYELYAKCDLDAWNKIYAVLKNKGDLISIRLMELCVHPNILKYVKIDTELYGKSVCEMEEDYGQND